MKYNIIILAILFYSCEVEKPPKEFYTPSLRQSFEVVNDISNRDYSRFLRQNSDDPEHYSDVIDLARGIYSINEKLQKTLDKLVKDKTTTVQDLDKLYDYVEALNAHTQELYDLNEYQYEELYQIPKRIELPIDSAEYWLLKLEGVRVLRSGLQSIFAYHSGPCWEYIYTDGVYAFSSTDTLLSLGDSYSVNITLGSIDTAGLARQFLDAIRIWRNDTLIQNNIADTHTVMGSVREIIFKPELKGNYKWEADYKYLKESGQWETITKSSNFIVK